MLIVLGFVILLIAFWALAFYRVKLLLSSITLLGLIILFAVIKMWPMGLSISIGVLILLVTLFFGLPILRRNFFSKYILNYFRRVQPHMSQTEKIALEAGDTWWEGELFRGKPNWKKLLQMEPPQLSKTEQSFLDTEVNELCQQTDDWKIVHDLCDLPKNLWEQLKKNKFFGLVINKKYGGKNFSALAHSSIVTKIASRSMSVAVNTMVPNSLGPAELIHLYGTPEQKKYYLPRLASGEEIPAFALTSPVAGSDATGITDSGIVCKGEYENETVIGVRLNWDKRYITLAPIATLLGVAFKMYDPEHLLGNEENIGITLALIPTKHPGVEIGNRHLPLHLAFMNGPTRGKDVFIPLEWLIGGPKMRGQGWHMMVECLAVGRGISIPALSTAIAQLCFRSAGAYAQVRHQFHLPIGKLEGIQEALARVGGLSYICEATRVMTASAVDENIKPSLASAITKYHLTELARIIFNDAMDIHAGKGIQLGPKNYLGLVYNAIPTSITVEGANILTRSYMIFGQGALRCHPYIRHEIEAAELTDKKQSLRKFDKILIKHLAYGMNNFVRTFTYALKSTLFDGKLFIPAQSNLSHYYNQLTRMSCALALVSDLSMAMLGGELKRLERLSARLGDVLSYLYLASAVLRYYENHQQPSGDLPFVHWALQWCLAKIQNAFDDYFMNFPKRFIGALVRRIIFPFGRAYRMPVDKLGKQVAELMLRPTALRDRLTRLCYVDESMNGGLAALEKAFVKLAEIEPIQIKLQTAISNGRIARHTNMNEQLQIALNTGILTAEEIKLLQEAMELQNAAIQVDEFSPETFVKEKINGTVSRTKDRKNDTLYAE